MLWNALSDLLPRGWEEFFGLDKMHWGKVVIPVAIGTYISGPFLFVGRRGGGLFGVRLWLEAWRGAGLVHGQLPPDLDDLLLELLDPLALGDRMVEHQRLVVVVQQLLEEVVQRETLLTLVSQKVVNLLHQDVVGQLQIEPNAKLVQQKLDRQKTAQRI